MNEQIDNIEKKLLDYYDGKLDEAGCDEVKQWISFSEQNHRMARRVYSLLLALNFQQVKGKINTEKALENGKKKRLVYKSRFNFWQWTQRVAVALIIPLVSVLVWQQIMIYNEKSYAEILEVHTNPGMTTKITLPDGSLVWLNSSSTLTYPSKFVDNTRSVKLSGEAYFEVTKDSKRHFVVNTPCRSAIEVYGTRFNVEAYEDEQYITTTLAEGKISFFYKDDKGVKRVIMNPGQKVTYNTNTNDIFHSTTLCVSELSWKDGEIIFDNTLLKDALRMLEKRFNVEFVVKDKEMYAYHFTGTFATQQLEKILKCFELSSRLRWRYMNNPNINQEKTKIEIYI